MFIFPCLALIINIDTSITNPFEYARITELNFIGELHDSSGDNFISVKEEINFDIHSASKKNLCVELWRGLEEYKADGLTTLYRINSVKQILPNGETINYTESPRIYLSDSDYESPEFGPLKWFHSEGPYSPYSNRYECLMIYPEPTYRDNLKFEIEYEIRGCTYKYKDCSEIYFQVFNGDETKYLKEFNFEFLIPSELMPSSNNYYTKFNGTDKIVIAPDISFNEETGYWVFSIKKHGLGLKASPNNRFLEFLIVSYGEDKNAFSKFAPENRYSNTGALYELKDEQKIYDTRGYKTAVCIVSLVVSLCICIYAQRVLSAKDIYKNIYKSKNDTSKNEYDYYTTIPEKLDLHVASGLFHCKDTNTDPIDYSFPAILISLSKKGFVDIQQDQITRTKAYYLRNEGGRFINVVDDDVGSVLEDQLTKSERKVFDLITRYTPIQNVPIKVDELFNDMKRDYERTNAFINEMQKLIQDYGFTHNYFGKAEYDEIQKDIIYKGKKLIRNGTIVMLFFNLFSYFSSFAFCYGAFIVLGLSFILNGIKLIKRSKDYVLLTDTGEIEYQKWHAFYNYLKNDTAYRESNLEEINNYDDYLLYAIALGLPIDSIDNIKRKFPKLTFDYSSINKTTNYIHHYRTHYHRRFRTTTRAATSRASFSSYGSGSYSRGGRGGGGGF